jgi:probable HAF family extracellular repeat protein
MARLVLAVVVLGVLSFLSPTALSTPYQITDVGTFDYLWITGSNSLGQVIGVVDFRAGFVWGPGTGFTYLPFLDGYDSSIPRAINNKGQIAGYSEYDGRRARACLWEAGKPVLSLDPHPTGQYDPVSYANGINESGQVVGISTLGTASTHGFLRSAAGEMEDITGDIYAQPYAVNDNSVVVGGNGLQPFMWDRNRGIIDLTPFVNGQNQAIDINNSGSVLLCTAYGSGVTDAIVWNEATGIHSIGTLPRPGGTPSTDPHDINNLGQVVGRSSAQPFVWDDVNGIQPLPKLPGHGYAAPSAINDFGQIAGCSIDSSGCFHFVIWTPVPEPSSVLGMLGGVACLIGLRKRRRIA